MVAVPEPSRSPFSLQSVIWTRGKGCGELASTLDAGSLRVEGKLEEFCRAERSDLLVTKRLTSFDLVSVAVPHEVDLEATTSIVAAVAGGPHSDLAAIVARQLGAALDVPAELLSAYDSEESRIEARSSLDALSVLADGMASRLVQTERPVDLVKELDGGTLLVAGAPGGSWLQRQFFGPGRRLQSQAPAGTVVIRSSPLRAFHLLREPESYMSPMLGSGDALRMLDFPVMPVAENGKLVGIVRRSALLMVGHGVNVGAIMEDPIAVTTDTAVDEIGEVAEALGGAPVPVIDDDGFLVGVVGP
jgi:CBS domain-containing protein